MDGRDTFQRVWDRLVTMFEHVREVDVRRDYRRCVPVHVNPGDFVFVRTGYMLWSSIDLAPPRSLMVTDGNSLRAPTAASLMIVSAETMAAILMLDPRISMDVILLQSATIQRMGILSRIRALPTEESVATLYAMYSTLEAPGVGASPPVFQDELSRILDMRPETFSRSVRALSEAGCLTRVGFRRKVFFDLDLKAWQRFQFAYTRLSSGEWPLFSNRTRKPADNMDAGQKVHELAERS